MISLVGLFWLKKDNLLKFIVAGGIIIYLRQKNFGQTRDRKA